MATNQSKHAVTVIQQSKNTVTIADSKRSIRPWAYDEVGFTYDQLLDSTGHYSIAYDRIGDLNNALNQAKNSVGISNNQRFIYPWMYDQALFTYDMLFDPKNNQSMYYDSSGLQIYSEITKHNA